MLNINDAQLVANTLRQQAETIRVLTEVGFDKDQALKAVAAGDLSQLAPSSYGKPEVTDAPSNSE